MNAIPEFIEQTACLRSQVEQLRKMVEALQAGLISFRKNLEPDVENRNLEQHGAEPPELSCPPEPTATKSIQCKTKAKSGRERRSAPRRRGNPVPILMSLPENASETSHGWVIDRSPEGLSVVAFASLPVGMVMNVRPAPAQ